MQISSLVECFTPGLWAEPAPLEITSGPDQGDIDEVIGFASHEGATYISLERYGPGQAFDIREFREVQSPMVISDELFNCTQITVH